MTLTAHPTFPPIGSATFNADAYAWAVFMAGTNKTELDALVTAVDADAAAALAQKILAAAEAAASANSADAAAASALAAAASAASVGIVWTAGTYAEGDMRYSPLDFATYRRRTTGASATDPSLDPAGWAPSVPIPGTGGATITGNTTLTSASAGAMSASPVAPGLYVTLPVATTCSESAMMFSVYNAGDHDYGVKDSTGTVLGWVRPRTGAMIGLADNATAAGVWAYYGLEKLGITASYNNPTAANVSSYIKHIALDATRSCILFGGATCYAIIYDASTQTWGTATSVRTSLGSNLFNGVKSATDQVLVCTCDATTGFEAVTLTIAGTAITVNTGTKATATLAGNIVGSELGQVIAVSTSFVVGYGRDTTTSAIRAIAISGTTPTIGAESALVVAVATAPNLYASGSVVRTVNASASTLSCKPYTVSGSTLSAGTAASASTSGADYRSFVDGNGNIVCNYRNSNHAATIFKLTATTEVASTAVLSATDPTSSILVYSEYFPISADKTLFISHAGSTTWYANILTGTSGTASAGTEITGATQGPIGAFASVALTGNYARMASYTVNQLYQFTFDCSGASPVIYRVDRAAMNASTGVGLPYGSDKRGVRYFPILLAGATLHCVGQQSTTGNAVFAPDSIRKTPPLSVTSFGSGIALAATETYLYGVLDGGTNGCVIQRVEAAA